MTPEQEYSINARRVTPTAAMRTEDRNGPNQIVELAKGIGADLGTSPLMRDLGNIVGGVTQGAGTALGMSGAGLLGLANGIVKYTTGRESETARGIQEKFFDTLIANEKNSEKPGLVPKAAAATLPNAKQPAPAGAAPAGNTKHPLEGRFKDPYEALGAMSDKQFMAFVDKHSDIPGLGYVKNGNKIDRVISRPDDKEEELLPISALKVIQGGYGIEQQREATNVLRADALELNKRKAFDDLLEKNATAKLDANGGTVKDYRPALLNWAINSPEFIHPAYHGEAKQLATGFNEFVKRSIKANPGMKDTPETRVSLLKVYQQQL